MSNCYSGYMVNNNKNKQEIVKCCNYKDGNEDYGLSTVWPDDIIDRPLDFVRSK